jgi:hypothetical protein
MVFWQSQQSMPPNPFVITSSVCCISSLLFLRSTLVLQTEAAVKADQVFLPVLENSSKAQKLRTTLAVFERSKFFFNLPGSLAEAIESASYLFVSSPFCLQTLPNIGTL